MELASSLFQARQKTTKALGRMISPAVLATPTGRSSGRAIAAVHKSVCDPSRRLLWCSKIKHFSRPAIEARNHADIGQCIQKLMAGAPRHAAKMSEGRAAVCDDSVMSGL